METHETAMPKALKPSRHSTRRALQALLFGDRCHGVGDAPIAVLPLQLQPRLHQKHGVHHLDRASLSLYRIE